MIIDKIKNISLYSNIPQEVCDFVSTLESGIALGRHDISNGVYANIEKYLTKSISEGKFEAHKNYIDVQLLLCGNEKIYYHELDGLNISEPYNKERDIMFFKDSIAKSPYVELDGTNFAVIYPHEAHAPQIIVNSSEEVKKVVIKIKV